VERARLARLGWEAPLEYETAAAPRALEPGFVRVAVEACGVCHRDLLDREGRFPFVQLPVTPGHEAVGRVVEVGNGRSELRVGDRVATMHRDACGECAPCRTGETSQCVSAVHVFGLLADGGYASEIVAPPSALYSVPEDLPPSHAAVLHCTFGTAYRDLVTLGKLSAGERVLVTGANGGVGSAAIQIAVRAGARVVAAVRDERHADFVRELGVHEVVVGGAFAERIEPVDLALDTVGAPTFLAALRALRIGGRLVVVGNVTRDKVPMNLGFVITRGLTVIGGSGATRGDMREVLAMHAATPFRFVVRRMPLARADEAQRLVREGGARGRIVLEPQSLESTERSHP
jgi:D-arabinose 1-dehydrogenase-like Zn-dependent alcohol dehydrogenase